MLTNVQAFLLIINVAATMILGMSNTYQQLVTSLKISDIKWVLQKFGDSRVGTNSPFSINRKREGKVSSWLAWLLLICTSMVRLFLLRLTAHGLMTINSQYTFLLTR